MGCIQDGKFTPSYTGGMAISLSPAAAQRIRGYLRDDPSAIGLRFGVRKTGCSGWGYHVDMARDRGEDDTVFDADGIAVFVDAQSLPEVDGTRIDFVQSGLNVQFTFENPQVAGSCGCGASFTTDPARAA